MRLKAAVKPYFGVLNFFKPNSLVGKIIGPRYRPGEVAPAWFITHVNKDEALLKEYTLESPDSDILVLQQGDGFSMSLSQIRRSEFVEKDVNVLARQCVMKEGPTFTFRMEPSRIRVIGDA